MNFWSEGGGRLHLIVAEVKAAGGKFITADDVIRANFKQAIW